MPSRVTVKLAVGDPTAPLEGPERVAVVAPADGTTTEIGDPTIDSTGLAAIDTDFVPADAGV